MFKIIFPRLLLLLLLIACAEEDVIPPGPGTQLLVNTHISLSPDSVLPWRGGPNKLGDFESGVSKEIFFIGNQSLFLEKTDSLSGYHGDWFQTYTGPMPVQGSRLELIAYLKGENLIRSNPEHNITISIHIWDDTRITSGNNLILEGDFDWTPIRITLDSFPAKADQISVSLSIPSTMTGKIYFDEINLTVR